MPKKQPANAGLTKADWALLLIEPNVRAVAALLAEQDENETGPDDELAAAANHFLDRLAAYRRAKKISPKLLRALGLPK